ncbi:MAG TPA: Mut7-C RNAse domain-containing protein [Bacteroidales bacterium]|jgi:uncharacterized protein with PIN domain|nr:Mut7-C RNAse domain-containing protein [Bacteroidales bacterium]
MNKAWFRFYEELNDFLPSSRRKQEFMFEFENDPSVKDVIESLGVPHPEVDLILINGGSADFSRKLQHGDRVSVYPVFESLDISDVQHLRPAPLRETKFILDVHLGKLARYLRLSGFDSEYDPGLKDNVIISRSLSGKRIILTRDKMLLKNRRVTHGYFVRSANPHVQIEEVVRRFDLASQMKAFTRCLECNVRVEDVSKEHIIDRLPEKTRTFYDRFWICPSCKRIYWEGSHYERMKEFVEKLRISGNS